MEEPDSSDSSDVQHARTAAATGGAPAAAAAPAAPSHPAAQGMTPAELAAERTAVRGDLLLRAAHRTLAEEIADASEGGLRKVFTSSFNFVLSDHLAMGARSLADLRPEARDFASVLFNALSILAELKKVPNVSLPDGFALKVYEETLFGPGTMNGGTPGSLVVTGYRYTIVSSVPHDKLRAFAASKLRAKHNSGAAGAQRGGRGGRRAARADDAMDVDGGGGADENEEEPEEEGGGGGNNGPTLAALRAEQWRPLGYALLASFNEAQALEKKLQALRAKQQGRGRRGPADASGDGDRPLGAGTADISKLNSYRWTGFKDPVDFHLRAVNGYLRVGTRIVGDQFRLFPGRVFDNRPFVTLDNGDVLRIGTQRWRYSQGDCPLNPDEIFNRTSGMVYGMHDSDGNALVHPAQRDPANYFGGGRPVFLAPVRPLDGAEELADEQQFFVDANAGNNNGEEEEEEDDQVPAAAAPRPEKRRRNNEDSNEEEEEEEEEGEEEEEEENEEDDAMLTHLTNAAAEAAPLANDADRFRVRRYQMRPVAIQQEPIGPDHGVEGFPFPAHVYELNRLVLYPEAIAWLPFPFPIGTVLDEDDLTKGLDKHAIRHAARKFAAVQQLQVIESNPLVAHARENIAARLSAFVAGQLSSNEALVGTNDLYGTVENTRFDMASVLAEIRALPEDQRVQYMDDCFKGQRRVVETAMAREARTAVDSSYPALTRLVADAIPSHDTMAFVEFFALTNGAALGSGLDGDGSGNTARGLARFTADLRRTIRAFLHSSIVGASSAAARDSVSDSDWERYARLGRAFMGGAPLNPADFRPGGANAGGGGGGGFSAETSRLINQASEDLLKQVEPFVEYIDSDLVACDDMLRLRREFQTAYRLLVISYQKQMAAVARDKAATQALIASFRREYWELTLKCAHEFDEIFKTSTNLPQALIGEARKFMTANCTREGLEAAGAETPQQIMDEKPFVQCMQEFNDLVTAVSKATPQSMGPVMLFYFCMFDGHTYATKRQEPATNPLLVGGSGEGKSFAASTACELLVPGTVTYLTNATTHAFHVEGNFDNSCIVIEEFKTSWLIPNTNDKDKGASDEINFFKNRLTKFSIEIQSPKIDNETRRRTLVVTKSSHHNVLGGATNQHMFYLDKNVERRFILYYVPRHINAGEGSNPADLNAIKIFENTDHGRVAVLRQRLINALFVYVKCMIKAGVIPDVLMASGETHVEAVFAELRKAGIDTSRSTKRHQILQLAANVQLYYACWFALFHPFQKEFYAQAGAPERWSPEAVLLLVTPNMVLQKDALVFALTLLDHLYAPYYVDATLCTLALYGLHVPYPERRQFACYIDPTTKNKVYDPNYLVLSGGATDTELCGFIVRLNKEFQLRAEDVVRIMQERSAEFVRSLGYKVTRRDGDRPIVVEPRRADLDSTPDAPVEPREFRAIIAEDDPFSKQRKGRRYAISIAFLEQRLGFRITDSPVEITKKLTRAHTTHHEYELTRAFAARYGVCRADHTMMTKAMTDAWMRRTLELAPGQLPTTLSPPPCLRYVTAYLPQPLSFRVRPTPAAAANDALMPFQGGIEPPRAPQARAPQQDEPPRPQPTEDELAVMRELEETLARVNLLSDDAVQEKREDPSVRTVAMHGTFMMLEMARRTDRAPMMRENHSRLLPTAKRNFAAFTNSSSATASHAQQQHQQVGQFGGAGGGVRSDEYSRAIGIKAATCDPDFTFACEQMRRVCHPGFPFLDALLGSPQQQQRAVAAAAAAQPDEPAPFAFGPMQYSIGAALAAKSGDAQDYIVYPRDNLFMRMQDATARAESRRTNDAVGQYADLHGITGQSTYGGLTFTDSNTGEQQQQQRQQQPVVSRWTSYLVYDAENAQMAPEVDAMDIDRTF